MTGKERVIAALQHKEPDRVPVMEYIFEHGIIEQILGRPSYWRGHFKEIKAYWEGRRDEVVESQKRDVVEFVRAVGHDGVTVTLVPPKGFQPEPLQQLDEETWRDWQGNVYKYSPLTEDLVLYAPKALEPQKPPENLWEPPPEPDPSEFELIDHVVKELGETHFIIARLGRRASSSYPNPFGLERWLLRLAEDPDAERETRVKAAEGARKMIDLLFEHGVDTVFLEADYASSTGPMMSPQTFRRAILPGMKILCSHVKRHGAFVIFHSCGVNRPLLDMFIEAGVDCYQSIQPEEDIVGLKRDFGDRLALWGGINIDMLIRGTPEQVKKEVREIILGCKKGGGFILGASHSLMKGTRAENYLAALEALREVGWYN
ncbi:hypothetical protein DRP77_06350 [Candidatus Poribacteria bacterium]|nr:MAG: hypothetical protein DRP77_06350 [Candidatus Poribacteria bacterium]